MKRVKNGKCVILGAWKKALAVAMSAVLIIGLWPGVAVADDNPFDERVASDVLAIGASSELTSAVIMQSANAESESSSGLAIKQVSVGGAGFVAALMTDGSLWMWGYGSEWELCTPDNVHSSIPVKVLENVEYVSCGSRHTAAIMKDGSLWTWGTNSLGLGETDRGKYNCPQFGNVMDDVIDVACGSGTTAAVKSDGSLWTWGIGVNYQLGDGEAVNRAIPVKVLDNVISVDMEVDSGGALKADGTLWMWGDNDCGELGDGTTISRALPIQVMSDVRSFSLGSGYSAAIKNDGSLWTWGANKNGQLGNGSHDGEYYSDPYGERVLVPQQVMSDVVSVACGHATTAVIRQDESLWTFGYNDAGQLGIGNYDGDIVHSVPVRTMNNVSSAAMSGWYSNSSGSGVSAAIKADGSLWTWGNNRYGAIGDGTKTGDVVDGNTSIYRSSPCCIFRDGEWLYGSSDATKPSKLTDVDVSFKASVSDKVVSTKVQWDDEWFDKSPTTYNHELATTSAVLACAAYISKPSASSGEAFKIKENFVNLGFDSDSFMYFNPKSANGYADANGGYNQVAYAFATRYTNEGVPIVAVTIRGTPGNEEWLGNLNINETGQSSTVLHEGFSLAARQVKTALYAYLDARGIDASKVRFLITGHSRGAAVANLLGMLLDEGAIEGVDGGRVFDYTFASPAVATANLNSAEYDNIFNIINPEDIVPLVPIPQWGFGRFGQTLVLPSSSNTSYGEYLQLKSKMNEIFKGYCKNEYGNPISYKPFLTGSIGTRALTYLVWSVSPSVDSFYSAKHRSSMSGAPSLTTHEVLLALFDYLWGDATSNDLSVLQQALACPAYTLLVTNALGVVVAGGLTGGISPTDELLHMHTQETYVSWMQSADAPLGEQPAIFRSSYRGLKVACPVDIHVYDSSGALVASIEDDAVNESLLEEGLPAMVVDGVKYVDIPSDAEYRIEVVARQSGTMDFQVEERNGYDAQPENVKAYLSVPLNEGEGFTCESTEGLAAEEHVLLTGDAEAEAQSVVSGDSVERVKISVSADGDGDAWGATEAIAGQEVTVHAMPTEGSQFVGWFLGGQKVSDDADYSFRPSEAVSLTAQFEQIQQPAIDLSGAVVSLSQKTYTYDGKVKTPTVTVQLDGKTLKNDTDYTVSYANNVNVGFATATVTGKGNYAGMAQAIFSIAAAPVGSGDSSSSQTSAISDNHVSSGASVPESEGGSGSSNNSDGSASSNSVSGIIKAIPTQWKRLYGDIALDTMNAIVREGFAETGGTVVVATFDGYWDALAAAGLAGLSGAPVLMTDGATLSPQTRTELERLAPSKVFVCGGPAAVSDGACAQIASVCGVELQRIYGDNAVATAAQIDLTAPDATGGKWSGEAFLCTSDGYWDALAAAPVAYALHMPIFLTEADGTLSGDTLDAIRACGITKVHIAGGTAAVSSSAEAALGELAGQRFAGDFAIQTSEAIARFGLSRGMTANGMGVATTGGYWDALAGAALCGKKNSVLVLVGDASSSSIDGFVGENSASENVAYVFGGPAAVGDDVVARLESVTAAY